MKITWGGKGIGTPHCVLFCMLTFGIVVTGWGLYDIVSDKANGVKYITKECPKDSISKLCKDKK